MYRVELKKTIVHLMSVLYFFRLWHRQDESNVRQTSFKLFYSIYYLMFPTLMFAGAMTSDGTIQRIFLIECSIITTVMAVKFVFIIWRKNQIVELLSRCSDFFIDNHIDFVRVNSTLRSFERLAIGLLIGTNITVVFISIVFPCLGDERKIFFKVAFPLDWKNDLFAYCMANSFIITEVNFCGITLFLSVFMWYIMTNCTLMYSVLQSRIRNIGTTTGTRINVNKSKILETEKETFMKDLTSTIDSYIQIRE